MATKKIDIVIKNIVENRSKAASKNLYVKSYIAKSKLHQDLVKRGIAKFRGFNLQEPIKNVNIYEFKSNF